MNVSCQLEIVFDSKEKAEHVFRSIKVDDFDFVDSRLDTNKLRAIIKANSVSSLLHTIDDYLACVGVAEKIVDKDK